MGDTAQVFGPADSVFGLDAATGVGIVIGPLRVGRGRRGAFFAAPRLAVRQARGGQVVVGHQTQIAQIGQQGEQVEQAQVYIELVSKQLVVVGGPR